MKTSSHCVCHLILPSIGVVLLPGTLSSAASPELEHGVEKHVLFVGADLSVQKDQKVYRVEDVAGESFIVRINNQPVRISTNQGTVALKVEQHLQLTSHTATILDLKGDRVYSAGNDPVRRRGIEAVEIAGAMQEAAENAQIRVTNAENHALALARSGSSFAAQDLPAANLATARARQQLEMVNAIAASDFATGREQQRQGQADAERQLFDAIDISFTVSSAERLSDAYVIIIARYRDLDSKPNEIRNWIFARSIGEVNDSPRYLHVKHAGFPPGFILENYDLHLYSQGQEIATTVSPKRVELSRADAAQYTLLDYLSAHKEATLPPTPALGTLPSDYRGHLGAPEVPKVCYVKVSKEGMPVDVYADESCSDALKDSYLATVLKKIWFKPALEKGRPVEGIAKVKLASLRVGK